MKAIPLNTICADGRSIAMKRDEALAEHRALQLVRLLALERQHMASCPTCNPDLAVTALVRQLWPEARVAE